MALRGSPWAYGFSTRKKRAQGRHPASPARQEAPWEAHLDLAPQGSLGELVRLDYWGLNKDGEGDGTYRNEPTDLDGPYSY